MHSHLIHTSFSMFSVLKLCFYWLWDEPLFISVVTVKQLRLGRLFQYMHSSRRCHSRCRNPPYIPGGYSKKFWRGCAAPVFDWIPLAKEILVENIPLAKENFLIMSPFLHDLKEFQPKYSLNSLRNSPLDQSLRPRLAKTVSVRQSSWTESPPIKSSFQKFPFRFQSSKLFNNLDFYCSHV